MSHNASALVQPVRAAALIDNDRRSAARNGAPGQALSRPLDGQDTILWGATVCDLSSTGVGLSVCFPFRPGTLLNVDLAGAGGSKRTVLTRVVHARDQADGTYHLGCEFVSERADKDVELAI